MLARLRDDVPNFVGLKVSDTPWDAFEPYLLDGLDVFVGPESLDPPRPRGRRCRRRLGTRGRIPAEVAAVVSEPTAEGAAGWPSYEPASSASRARRPLKRVVAARGVPVRSDVRAPLRDLTGDEAGALETWLATAVLVGA